MVDHTERMLAGIQYLYRMHPGFRFHDAFNGVFLDIYEDA